MYTYKTINPKSSMVFILILTVLFSFIAPGGVGLTGSALAEEQIQYVPYGGCTATASSYTGHGWGEEPELVTDGNLGTKWCSGFQAEDTLPQWITIDLGQVYDKVTQLRYFLNAGEWTARIMDHEVWVSENGTDFTKVYEGSWPNVPGIWREDNFEPVKARYARLIAVTAGQNESDPAGRASASEIQIGYVGSGSVAAQPIGIEITSVPAKTEYTIGDSLDTLGLAVSVNYDDGTSRALTAEECQLSGFDSSTEGTKTITVLYNNFTAAFNVTVAAQPSGGTGNIEYVPSENYTATASSFTGGGWGEGPELAVDGNEGTKWCSGYQAGDVLPQWITIDLGQVYDNVTQLRYFLRQQEWTARIMEHEIWVSENGADFTKVYEGSWPNVPGVWREDSFDPVKAKYVKLVATSAGANIDETATRASASEIQIGCSYDENSPRFAGAADAVEAKAGDTVTIQINRNEAAQALSGTYTIVAPTGWTVVSGSTFSAGSAADQIMFSLTDKYISYNDTIQITPVAEDGTPYTKISVRAKNTGLAFPEGRITVITPAYRSEISSNTNIEFVCPGGKTASIYVQKQPDDIGNVDTNGTRETIGGIINLDSTGRGSVTFPADEYPKGPITLRIRVWKDGADLDDGYLQLYNRDGVQWKTGLESAPVNPATEGMEVTFQDDFKTMPTISKSGEGTKYTSVKPDTREGGQFGFAAFEDYDGPYNPFSIVGGEYMKITTKYQGEDYTSENAKWNQKMTTGMLSSEAMDGTGFHTQGNTGQYFEARIFCPPNPGMWPAFWTLTSNNFADNPAGWGGEPTDELDILEGYMKWPSESTLAWHPWDSLTGSNPSSAIGHGGAKPLLDDAQFGYINLAMGFHTFGVYITEDTTFYYVDNIEVASHETLELSYKLGNYFLVNGAISGHEIIDQGDGTYKYNDDPFSFFRYGNEADMYIDWVRVYEECAPDVPAPPVIAPIADQTVNAGTALQFTVAATDANGDAITLSAANLPEGATFDTAAGVFNWTSAFNQYGSYKVTLTANDGTLSDSMDVNITVNKVEHAPVIIPVVDQTVDEGSVLQFKVAATDADGDALTLSTSGLPAGAGFDATEGTFSWTPDYTQAGSYTVHFDATDGILTGSIDAALTVNNVKAQVLTSNLTGYINGLNISKLMKNLLVKKIKDVTSDLDKGKYKQAMVKLKVFMLEVKILEPRVLAKDQADYILDACLDVITAIKADAQHKDKSWVDSKVQSLIDTIEKFKSGKATDIFDSIMKGMDDLINKMK